MHENDQNQQLVQSIQALTQAMAASERRIRHLGMIILILAGLILLPKAGALMTTAQASTGLLQELGLVEKDLTHLHSILANLDTLLATTAKISQNPAVGQGIADLFALTARLKQDSDVLRQGLVQASTTPEQFKELQKDPAALQSAINQASPVNLLLSLMQDKNLSQGLSDLLTLTTRFKQDSDILRAHLVQARMNPVDFEKLTANPKQYSAAIDNTSPTQILFSIQSGIKDEIHFLNGNIQTMVAAIDSTMGRAGRMMSPMPMPFGY